MPTRFSETIIAKATFRFECNAGYLSASKLLHVISVVELLTILFFATLTGEHPLSI